MIKPIIAAVKTVKNHPVPFLIGALAFTSAVAAVKTSENEMLQYDLDCANTALEICTMILPQ